MNVSMHEQGVLQDGTPLKDGLSELSSLGADVVGINCRLGPYHMIQALEGVPLLKNSHLSVYPNSSLPPLKKADSSMIQIMIISEKVHLSLEIRAHESLEAAAEQPLSI